MSATDAKRDAADAAPVGTRGAPDFDRPVACILGLPFDLIGVAEAVRRIRDAAFARRRCFVSTPNLNFAMVARRDPPFRGSVLRSDLSLIDGMPLVWIGRLIGLEVPERVSGADVFEALLEHRGPPLTVFLFGGPPGAAAAAGEAMNRRAGGLRCVGHDAAGFGSIESMSRPDCIERINRSGAQFVVVSLGAGKGQAWIEHNAARLDAPVLSHLGAVVNFAAGSVRRAPRWMQRGGLEWLWRVREEPALWRRYWRDGRTALGLMLGHVLPDAAVQAWRRRPGRGMAPAPGLRRERSTGGQALVLSGDWSAPAGLGELRAALRACALDPLPLRVEMEGVVALSHAATALLMLARGWFGPCGGLTVTGVSPALRASLRRQLALDALLGEAR